MDRKLKISVVISLALIGLFTLAFTPYLPFFGPRRSLATNYLAENAVFDGFTQYLFKTADFSGTGLSDSASFTFSCWVRRGTNTNASMLMEMANASSVDRLQLYIDANGRLNVGGFQFNNSQVLGMIGTNTIQISNGWTHIYIACNVADATQNKIYINGILDATNTQIRVNVGMDMSGVNYRYWIGRYATAVNFLNGAISEYWFDDAYFDNPTKFYTNGCPVFLGSDGSVPTGSQPCFYFRGSGNNFATNFGSCGTVFGITNGPLTTTNKICL